MSATTQPVDFSDLYTDLSNRVRLQTGITASQNEAKRYIDQANADIYIGTSEKFPWARRRDFLTLQPQYTTGTLTATVGSGALTGSSTAWNTANDYGVNNMRVGGKIVIDGRREVHKITAVSSDTAATMEPNWIGDTASSLTYTYFEDEYALASDFLRPYDVTSFDDEGKIQLIGNMEFGRNFPRNRIPGQFIKAATLHDLDFSGSTTRVRRVQFAPPPSVVRIIPYSYITSNTVVTSSGTAAANFSNDTDEPIIPRHYRHVIVLRALYWWYRDKRDDARSLEVNAEFESLLSRIVGDHEIGQQRASMRPMVGAYARARRPYRSRGQRFDINGRFDRFED